MFIQNSSRRAIHTQSPQYFQQQLQQLQQQGRTMQLVGNTGTRIIGSGLRMGDGMVNRIRNAPSGCSSCGH